MNHSHFYSNQNSKPWSDTVKDSQPTTFDRRSGKAELSSTAPLNTDITLSLPIYDANTHEDTVSAYNGNNPLPKEFCWRVGITSDSSAIEKKKNYIATPLDQYQCGACWAFATATALSDAFVISDKLYGHKMYKPELSPTWLLNIYPQDQCGGGNPFELLQYLYDNKKGVASQHCIDYSWCTTDQACNPTSYPPPQVSDLNKYLNSTIPDLGCYEGGDHLLYNISSPAPQTMSVGAGNMRTTADLQRHAKTHIYNNGPLIAGMIILANFQNGDFTNGELSTNGIYFEAAEYTNETVQFTDGISNTLGGHAVNVIGWGIQGDCFSPELNKDGDVIVNKGVVQTTRQDIPYWYARNSWGTKWGYNGGYFKIAMYPHNKYIQFDKLIHAPGPSGSNSPMMGGMTAFFVDELPKEISVSQIKKEFTDKLPRPSSSDYSDYSPSSSKKLSPETISLIVLGVIAFAAILIWLVIFITRKRANN
jgi:hypothetical protein